MSLKVTRKSRMPEVRRAFALGAHDVTEWAADTAAQYWREEAPVRTGELRGSIRSVRRNQHRKDTVATAKHAPYVNYGTSRQAANPFADRGTARVAAEFPRKAAAIVKARL